MRLPREGMPQQQLQKGLKRGRVDLGAHGANELAAAQVDGAKAGDRLAGGRMEQDRILDLGRHPHLAAVPCCWKWHSSTLQSSTPRRRARRGSFYKHRDRCRVGLGNLGSGLAQPEPHLAEDSLALAHTQHHPVAQAKMDRELLAVPQMTGRRNS